MLVKSKKKHNLLAEGPHIAKLASVTGKPNDVEPKKVVFRFQVDGNESQPSKELPVSFEERSPLRKDAEILLGRQLTAAEAEQGLDMETLLGNECQIVVAHKPGVGGKPMAAVTLIQAVPQPSVAQANTPQ